MLSIQKPTIAVLGGCHVVGYALEDEEPFSVLLTRLLEGTLARQVANVQFIHLPKHLVQLEFSRLTYVVLQLGNYEFSASFRLLLRQFKRAFNLTKSVRPSKQPSQATTSGHSNVANHDVPHRNWLAEHIRVSGLSLLTATLWLTSAKHRRAFRALNESIQRCPNTTFIILSPFPCLEPAANALRQFGGQLMRRRLRNQPNLHWFDSHQLLRADPCLFVDQLHLNGEAHRMVAHSLAALSSRPAISLTSYSATA